MRRKFATKMLLTLACLCLLAGVVHAKPAECWYTGYLAYDYFAACNYCYLVYGNAPNPDGSFRDVFYEYECPGGVFGYDYAYTQFLGCYYYSSCFHM